MKKLDRLGWAAGIIFTSYGVRVGIRSNTPDIFEHVVERLPFSIKPLQGRTVRHLYSLKIGGAGRRKGVRSFNLLYSGSERLARSMELGEVFDELQTDLQLCVAENARHRVFVHSGVVAWEGRAVLLPGRSFSGKTTLVIELLKRGATYYSDEYALLDSRGRVHPFARPLGVRDDVRKLPVPTPRESFTDRVGRRPLAVDLVVSYRYRPDKTATLHRLTPGQGAQELISHTVPVLRQPHATMRAVGAVSRGAHFYRGVRLEAAEAADEIIGLLSAGRPGSASKTCPARGSSCAA